VRVGVQVLFALDQLAFGLEAFDDVLVAVLDETARVVADLCGELALAIHRADSRYTGALERLVVVLAEAGGGVHDAGAVLGGHIGCRMDAERALGLGFSKVGEQWLVDGPYEGRALHAGNDLERSRVFIVSSDPCLGHDVAFCTVFDEDVVYIRADGQGQVGRQRPGGGGPRKEEGVAGGQSGSTFAVGLDPELYGHCRIMHVLVAAELEFVVGQYG